ncbi:putative small secreted protein [Scopulibacillus darangshiensis]|uniref:Putative small secreted protein n=1 Tax=Scopulibacillus darangshiensis TaxID=442528 RepID=A0A4R2NXA2_9BACL|nr:PepSY domain-containing protein [Scopulibacillus darangshiensis]TCP26662.1 putative small secreted protein [Scopulibacillus darangshiensis]
MKLREIACGFAAGLAGGYLLQKAFNNKRLSSEQALQHVKKAAKGILDIDGAWIYLSSQDMNKNGLSYKVYKGGLTAKDEQNIHHYDFIVDASTGTVLELSEQS